MPQIRFRNIALILLIGLSAISISAQKKFDCLSVDETGLLSKSFKAFEEDIFEYYNFGTDTVKTYKTFLTEIATLSVNLRKLPTDRSIQITRQFKKQANSKNSLWIRLAEYENQYPELKAKSGTTDKKNGEEIFIFNYRGGVIQCLKNTNESSDFKDIISTLEKDANVSTSLIAQRLYYITDKEFNTSEIKKFIAFDIYYSILMVIEKAFG
ncbi:hypothetical protein [Aquimarina brevivitae]|uniref:Uncharacterized protein n=1 Tax=Aquimarina brevivitae TaxID=323412 RepID=A0A4Q7P3N1_9FLAO|nr:hypothetical protein [Aquimarina brevivitae]RZS93282.1 hypothetical protein EV197_1858 [Aquimarina brevivitae]